MVIIVVLVSLSGPIGVDFGRCSPLIMDCLSDNLSFVAFSLLGAVCFCASVNVLGLGAGAGSVTEGVLTLWVLAQHLLGGTNRSQWGRLGLSPL